MRSTNVFRKGLGLSAGLLYIVVLVFKWMPAELLEKEFVIWGCVLVFLLFITVKYSFPGFLGKKKTNNNTA